MENKRIKQLKDKGRYMSLLLRHKPENENLQLDEYGFVLIENLLNALNITEEELNYIVESNNKQRFIFDEGHIKIRATQGHSIPIKLFQSTAVKPPHLLYHGTSVFNKTSILKSGLDKRQRHHVHLSEDKDTAINVGLRYAKTKTNLWIIEIEAKLMDFDGYKFYKTENGVWLTDHVPPKYIK